MRYILSVLLAIVSLSASGEKYFWVGGAGSWSEISHWATSSGGNAFHAVVPGIHDTVYFDSNSGFTAGSNTVTINTGATCHTMIWDGAPNNPVLRNRAGFTMRVFGSLALQEAMTVEGDLRWSFRATQPGNTIKTAGNRLYDVEFNGSGAEWTLSDALQVDSWDGSAIQLIEGSLHTNDQQVNASRLEIVGGRPVTLRLGSSEVNLKHSFYAYSYLWGADQTRIYLEQAVINIANDAFRIEHIPQTFDAGTSVINLRGHQGYFYAGFAGQFHEVNFFGNHATLTGQETTFHKVAFHGNGDIDGNNTFESLQLSPGKTYRLEAGSTQTIVAYVSLDTPPCTSPIIITSSRMHTAAYLHKENGVVNGMNLVLQDIHARGGAAFHADASIDLGNNAGWQFTSAAPTDYYWVGGSGNWSDGSHWSTESGGAPAHCIPTAFDNVVFDAGSGFTGASDSVVVDGPAFCKDMTWREAPSHPILKTSNKHSINMFGSLTLQEAMTVEGQLQWRFRSGQPGNTIQTSGNRLYMAEFNGSGGEWTLVDALQVDAWDDSAIQLIEGSLHGFYDFFYGAFGGPFHEVNFFGMQATLTGQETTFHRVVFYENGQILGSNTFGRLMFSAGKSYRLESNRTQTIEEEVEAKGNPCFITNLSSTIVGQQAYLQMQAPDTVIVDFIILRDIHATGGARFIGAPNTTSLANNAGWDLAATPGGYIFGFGADRELNCDDLPYLITTDSFNPNPGTTFLWHDNSTEGYLLAHDFGQYHILVSYADACSIRDTLVLTEPPMPAPHLGADMYLEPGESLSLHAGPDEGHSYLWSTGATTSGIQVSGPGHYWVHVTNAYHCEASDTIWVFSRPVVVTSIPDTITSTTAVLGGAVLSDGGVGVTERGVFWGPDRDPFNEGTQQQIGTGVGTFSFYQEGLRSNTTYYVTAYAAATSYAENTPGMVTGSTESFTTLPEPPVVETSEPSAVQATTAVVGGSILSDGGLPITDKGVFWGSDTDPEQHGARLSVADGGWDYPVALGGLSPNHRYYYVAFATNDEGPALGAIKSFVTRDTLPEVVTSLPTDIAALSARLGGEVIADGGAAVTDRGVWWGTHPSPVTNGNHHQEGAGQGAFSFLQEGLEPNTRYYVAAYAANIVGTAYGATETFVTEFIIPDIFIPNAIMPASIHQENTVFMPTFDILPPEYSLTIYNRWGQRLFVTDDPVIGWDGTVDNNPAPHNSYSYTITYRYPNGEEYSHRGVFLLIR